MKDHILQRRAEVTKSEPTTCTYVQRVGCLIEKVSLFDLTTHAQELNKKILYKNIFLFNQNLDFLVHHF